MRRSTLGLIVGVCASIAACGGGDSSRSTGPNNSANGSMSASIDGRSWTALAARAARSSNIIAVSGSDASATVIAFAVVDSGTKTYTISRLSATNALVTTGGSTWTAASTQGSGTI